jgi:membrane protease YdiL (CAAX protease family)
MDAPDATPSLGQGRFWASLILLGVGDWLLGRGFGLLARLLDADHGARALFRDGAAHGYASIFLNVALQVLPHAAAAVGLVALTCAATRIDWRTALGLRRIRPWWLLAIGLLAVGIYQAWVFPLLPVLFVSLYALRFLPSALAEEAVFRAGFCFLTHRRFGPGIGIALSTALFAGAHASAGPWMVLNAVALGLGFAVVYLRTKSIVPGTILHAFSNLCYACVNY